jgi:hypothetical protein
MLVHCRRLPLGLSYPEILDAIVATWHQAVDRGRTAVVVLDASGVGRPLADQLAALRIPHIGVIITGGTEVGWSAEQPDVIRIPKQRLILAARLALESRQLSRATDAQEVDLLMQELAGYRVKVTKSANEVYDAREGMHDDLVLALALPIWFRNYRLRFWDAAQHRQREERQKDGGDDEWSDPFGRRYG